MRLICPGCGQHHHVALLQLKVAAGHLRCAACGWEFNGFSVMGDRSTLAYPVDVLFAEDLVRASPQPNLGWSFATFGLLLLLTTQIALFAGSSNLGERVLRWAAGSVYAVFDEHLPHPSRPDRLRLVSHRVQPLAHRSDVLGVSIALYNDAVHAQPWPRLRMVFLDRHGQPAAGAIIRPAQYLGDRATDKQRLAPAATETISFYLADPGIAILSYEVSVLSAD